MKRRADSGGMPRESQDTNMGEFRHTLGETMRERIDVKQERILRFADRRQSRLPPSEPNVERAFKEFIRAHQWENRARHEQAWFGGPNGI